MTNYWLISAGKDGELWPTFWYKKVVAIGWSALGDLRNYKDRDQLKRAIVKNYPGIKPGTLRNTTTQTWKFCNDIKPGEVIFVRSYGAIIGIGVVQGKYDFVPKSSPLRKKLYSEYFDDEFPNIRHVRWLSLWGGLKQPLTFTRLTLMQ